MRRHGETIDVTDNDIIQLLVEIQFPFVWHIDWMNGLYTMDWLFLLGGIDWSYWERLIGQEIDNLLKHA